MNVIETAISNASVFFDCYEKPLGDCSGAEGGQFHHEKVTSTEFISILGAAQR